jgi:hypothetical protein
MTVVQMVFLVALQQVEDVEYSKQVITGTKLAHARVITVRALLKQLDIQINRE